MNSPRIALSFVGLALCGALALAQVPALDAKPAHISFPTLPDIQLGEERPTPAPGTIERDGALADRFTAAGQSVRYSFESRAGEVSIFELSAAGYARGWSMKAALRVFDASGKVLAMSESAGGTLLRCTLAFTAPREGTFELEVDAVREYFRYGLVRHSSYAARAAEAVELATHERVHGWLAGGDDVMRFRVPARAGESLSLRVEGTREEARREHNTALSARLDGATDSGGMSGGMRGMRMMEGGSTLFPELRLEVPTGDVVATARDFARLVPAKDGFVDILVRTAPESQAALFDLVVTRAEPTHAVHGMVVDANDEPCAGIELTFLREPFMAPWISATTDAEGRYRVELPTADYRVRLTRGDAAQVVRAGVKGATELNLLATLR